MLLLFFCGGDFFFTSAICAMCRCVVFVSRFLSGVDVEVETLLVLDGIDVARVKITSSSDESDDVSESNSKSNSSKSENSESDSSSE